MKNKEFNLKLRKLIRNKTHCYFISPHLDDAAFSAGGLISHLAQKKVPVTVINVFTDVHNDTPTISAKAFLRQSRHKNAKELFAERKREDKELLKKIGVKVVNLDFKDVMWRKKEVGSRSLKLISKAVPEFEHIYPTYRFHAWTGKVSSQDNKLKVNLSNKLNKIVESQDDYMIFCPVAIGRYIDHVIVRDVCSKVFENPIYWSDFNYSMEFAGETKFIQRNKLEVAFFEKEASAKRKLIESYKSQIYAIFPHGKVPIVPDFFYL